MVVIQEIVAALWQHDFAALANPHVVGVVYLVMFATLFLENGLLPASFLPGDSLLLLAGALIAKGVMDFVPTIAILTAAASLGCWLSYVQGRWLGNTQTVKGWLAHLPHKYHQRATCMFDRHAAGAARGPFSGVCPHPAANHGRDFWPAEPPLPVLQLAERPAVGLCGDGSWLCAEHDPVCEAP